MRTFRYKLEELVCSEFALGIITFIFVFTAVIVDSTKMAVGLGIVGLAVFAWHSYVCLMTAIGNMIGEALADGLNSVLKGMHRRPYRW